MFSGPLAAEFVIICLAIQCFMEHIILRLRDRHRMRYGQATKDRVPGPLLSPHFRDIDLLRFSPLNS
jgi:hypothetical protein